MELNRQNYFTLKESSVIDEHAAERFSVSLSTLQNWKKENLTYEEIQPVRLKKKHIPNC